MLCRMAARHAETPREVVTCRIEPELLRQLDVVAERERRSRSEMIEIAVRALVEGPVVPKKKGLPIRQIRLGRSGPVDFGGR